MLEYVYFFYLRSLVYIYLFILDLLFAYMIFYDVMFWFKTINLNSFIFLKFI